MDFRELTGRSILHLQPLDELNLIHIAVYEPFQALKAAAREQEIELKVASSFRSFERQLKIWCDKAEGRRPLRDENGELLDYQRLSDEQIIKSILHWSAIPGTSRHHWGTDLDLYDYNPYLESGDRLQLINQEYTAGGPNGKLTKFLSQLIKQKKIHFYRPYTETTQGHQAELWHYSFAPIAEKYEAAYTFEVFKRNLKESSMPFRDYLLDHAQEIYTQFIL